MSPQRIGTSVHDGGADADVVQDYIDRLSRWGRWGPDDQLGALNLVTAQHRVAAAGEVRSGRVISLTMAYDQAGPQQGGLRANPVLLTTATGTDVVAGRQVGTLRALGAADTRMGFADDSVFMPTQCGTQWDALAHIFRDGRMWNGYAATEHSSRGAARNGIQHWTDQMVLRGVLADVARHHQVDALEPGYPITVQDLEATLAAQKVTLGAGDALFVRTGQLGRRHGRWGDYAGGPAPGLSLYTAPWLAETEIVAVATDTWGVEVRPNEVTEFQPLHQVALVHLGLAFGEMFDLDALADDCARDGRYSFLLAATPLPITGAVGSPVAAVAVK